jgi:hypothetical protein
MPDGFPASKAMTDKSEAKKPIAPGKTQKMALFTRDLASSRPMDLGEGSRLLILRLLVSLPKLPSVLCCTS